MATAEGVAMDATPQQPAHAARRRTGLSIQSILLIMLLLVSITSNVVVGILGYLNGNESLRTAAIDKVVEVRDSRAREITRLFDTIENTLLVHSRGRSVVDASVAFNATFAELQDVELTDEERQQVEAYFRDEWGPRLGEAIGQTVDVEPFLPSTPAGRYLTLHYTAAADTFSEALEIDDAGDGSTWSAVHAEYHDYFRRMTTLLDYQDVLLIDADGNVVYSAYKGVDLGTNLLDGPYEITNLATAYQQAMAGRLLESVTFTDFQTYRPSLDTPAAWAVSLIADGGTVTGALAIEMPIERIAAVMTGNGDWEQSGLGASGETYLVGRDGLMRSPSRSLIEDPDRYAASAQAMGRRRPG